MRKKAEIDPTINPTEMAIAIHFKAQKVFSLSAIFDKVLLLVDMSTYLLS